MAFFHVDPSGAYLGLGFYALLGIALGAIIFSLMRFPQLRRAEYQSPLGCGTLVSGVAGGSILLALVITGYVTLFMRFYRADVDGDRITLHYYLPQRTVVFDKEQVQGIKTSLGERMGLSPIIELRDGTRYRGRPIPASQYHTQLEQFRAALLE